MAQSELPAGFELEVAADENKIYLKSNGKYIVTQTRGLPKHVRGVDRISTNRATAWARAFVNGSYSDNYEVER